MDIIFNNFTGGVGDEMLINYWDCKFSDYDEMWDGEDEIRLYGCTHPDGTHVCDLDNKFAGDKGNCRLIDKPKVGQMKYNIGDELIDEDGCRGIVCVKWDDGDLSSFESNGTYVSDVVIKFAGDKGNCKLIDESEAQETDENAR